MGISAKLAATGCFESMTTNNQIGVKFGTGRDPAAEFVRSDTIRLYVKVTGEDVTGLTAASTFKTLVPDAIIATKSVGGGITVTAVNDNVAEVRVVLDPGDTSSLDAGDKVVFDVELVAPNTPGGSMQLTKLGSFTLVEDYTLG